MDFKTLTVVGIAVGAGVVLGRRVGALRGNEESGVLGAGQVRDLYDRVAPGYDLVASAYELLGGRRLGRLGVDKLALRSGDTAVDLGCGTGVHLPDLVRAVGARGRVIGVDISREMLDRARARIGSDPGAQVELVQQDVRRFEFPDDTRGVLSTFGLEMVPEHDEVIARACEVLAGNGGRIAVSGLRRPKHWPDWTVDLAVALNKPFRVSRAYESFHPWEAVREHSNEICYETAMLGAVYLSVGELPG